MSTWADLRELRESGKKPSLPLCVTTAYSRCDRQAHEGAMVVVHRAGERLDVELLHGLEVEVHLDDCAQATAVARLIRERAVQPKRFAVFCRCEGECGVFWPRDCRHGAACVAAWEALCRRAR